MALHATRGPQVVVYGWLAEQPDAKVTVVGANRVALYRGDSATKDLAIEKTTKYLIGTALSIRLFWVLV